MLDVRLLLAWCRLSRSPGYRLKRVAIIGGGIAGLSAAFALEKARRAAFPLEYVVYEASARAGGVLLTEHIEGCVVEGGPDSFLTEKSWAADFCRELGLGDQLISSNDAQRKTYIFAENRLVPMPDGLAFVVPTRIWPIVFSPLFSLSTKRRMAREWFLSPREATEDESVADFVSRHYGPEMTQRLVDPLLSGVYGGSAARLSVRSVLPRFVEMEKKFGSLGKGMIAARKKTLYSHPRPIFTSLKSGMQKIAIALTENIPESAVRLNTKIDSVSFQNGQWTVSAGLDIQTFDAVGLAVPAYSAASMLQATSPELAHELSEIPYSSSVAVTMGFDREKLGQLPRGFGFLVPRGQGKRILAVTFAHQKFPGRAPPGLALIRCFLAGTEDGEVVSLEDGALQRTVRDELRQMLGLNVEPRFTRIFRWQNAMAQYTVGHAQRVERIQAVTLRFPRLALAGNAYSGIGVPDCIRSGNDAARRILAALDLPAADIPLQN
jgi:protoporphyrinogen/coproporphyrinogen III oxidase